MMFPFVKMHGAANDFVMIDHREPFLPEDVSQLVTQLCDRRRGVGADGVLLLEADHDHDFAMRYFNADGNTVPYCGNGARCIAHFALELGLGDGVQVRFRTDAGSQSAQRVAGGIQVRFGRVERPGPAVTLDAAGRTFAGLQVLAGVPHFVVAVEDLRAVPLAAWGRALRQHPHFAPAGANVDFVTRSDGGAVTMRTYERGVEGETMACGSGAIASAIWSVLGGGSAPVSVRSAGGDTLEVGLEEDGASAWLVTLSGPAEVAYTGTWDDAAGNRFRNQGG